MAVKRTPQVDVRSRWLWPKTCIRWTARKPNSMGIQKVRPRNASTTVVATAPGMPNDVNVKAITPSTTPIPWGVMETIQNRIPMAYPATSVPRPTGW